MIKKAAFYDFFNRRSGCDFDQFISESVEDEDYINWNDYVLPMHYGDAELEYNALRHGCAIFDGTPFRKVRIHGSGAGKFLDHLVTRPVSALASMRATYVVFCNEDGSLKDDSVLFKFDEDDYLIMPSDVDHIPYFEGLRERLDIDDVVFTDRTFEITGLAIQGPLSAAALLAMGFDGVEQLKPFEIRDYEIDGNKVQLSRTGFTADLGYECWVTTEIATFLAGRVEAARSELNIPVPGYGLSVVQACRLEGGFIVAGWDCATEVDPQPGFERSPYELGLGWLVDLEATPFVGRDALAEQKKNGHTHVLRSFTTDTTDVPEDGAVLLDGTGLEATEVGIATCSNWSWGQNAVIGNASMRSEHADLISAWVEIAGNLHAVRLSRGPLFNPNRRNEVPASVELNPGRL
jgi:aminomethyltransferase